MLLAFDDGLSNDSCISYMPFIEIYLRRRREKAESSSATSLIADWTLMTVPASVSSWLSSQSAFSLASSNPLNFLRAY
jgi:hypothetical protein